MPYEVVVEGVPDRMGDERSTPEQNEILSGKALAASAGWNECVNDQRVRLSAGSKAVLSRWAASRCGCGQPYLAGGQRAACRGPQAEKWKAASSTGSSELRGNDRRVGVPGAVLGLWEADGAPRGCP